MTFLEEKNKDNNLIEFETVEHSVWQNNTDKFVSFKLITNKPKKTVNKNGEVGFSGYHSEVIIVEPGTSLKLPSVYDNAIKRVENGFVVGGKAPQLTKVGVQDVPLHSALEHEDIEILREKKRMKDLLKQMKEEKELAEARELLAKYKSELEELKSSKPSKKSKRGRKPKVIDNKEE